MTTLDRSATLDPRGLEAAARVIAHQNSEILGHDTWGELLYEQRDCLHSEAAEIITAYLAALPPDRSMTTLQAQACPGPSRAQHARREQ